MADRFESFVSLLGDDVSVRWLITATAFPVARRRGRRPRRHRRRDFCGSRRLGPDTRCIRPRCSVCRFAWRSHSALSTCRRVCNRVCRWKVPPTSRPSRLSCRRRLRRQVRQFQRIPRKQRPRPCPIRALRERETTMKAIADDRSESPSHSSLAMLSRAAPWIAAAYVVGVVCFLLRLLTALWGGHRLRARHDAGDRREAAQADCRSGGSHEVEVRAGGGLLRASRGANGVGRAASDGLAARGADDRA